MIKFLILLFIVFYAQVALTKTLRIVTGEYVPYSGESISKQGISTQVIKAVFNELQIDIVVEFMPWNRAMNHIKNATVSGSFPWTLNAERQKDMLFSQPIHRHPIVLFVKKGSPMETKQTFSGKVICQPSGWDISHYQKVMENNKMFLVRPINLESCFRMLALDRVDMVIINEKVGQDMIQKIFGDKSPISGVRSSAFQKDSELYFVVPKKYPDAQKIVDQFNKGLDRIKKNGVYNAITNSITTCETCNLIGLR